MSKLKNLSAGQRFRKKNTDGAIFMVLRSCDTNLNLGILPITVVHVATENWSLGDTIDAWGDRNIEVEIVNELI